VTVRIVLDEYLVARSANTDLHTFEFSDDPSRKEFKLLTQRKTNEPSCLFSHLWKLVTQALCTMDTCEERGQAVHCIYGPEFRE